MDKLARCTAVNLDAFDEAVTSYVQLRPSRTEVHAALARLRSTWPSEAMGMLRIFLGRIDSGDWTVEEPPRLPEYVDERGVRYVRPSTLIRTRDGAIRNGWRACHECDGSGWHHREYPNGTTSAFRCAECRTFHARDLANKKRRVRNWTEVGDDE